MQWEWLSGLQIPDEATKDPEQEGEVEEFFKASRKQAEERTERSVIYVFKPCFVPSELKKITEE